MPESLGAEFPSPADLFSFELLFWCILLAAFCCAFIHQNQRKKKSIEIKFKGKNWIEFVWTWIEKERLQTVRGKGEIERLGRSLGFILARIKIDKVFLFISVTIYLCTRYSGRWLCASEKSKSVVGYNRSTILYAFCFVCCVVSIIFGNKLYKINNFISTFFWWLLCLQTFPNQYKKVIQISDWV